MGRDENHEKEAGEEGPQEWEAGQNYVACLVLQKVDVEAWIKHSSFPYLCLSTDSL